MQNVERKVFKPVNAVLTAFHTVVLLGAVGLAGYAASTLFHGAPSPASQPSVMEEVDWKSPQSSIYCLACHKQVAPAMAGLDVQQGHSHNVVLTADQIEAVKKMGTVAGPEGVLICMSCHQLGSPNAHMLADTLSESKLCAHCHPDQFTLTGTVHDLRKSAPEDKNRVGQTAETGGPCSACHLSHHYARAFEPSELDPDGRCVPCHQIGRAAARHARATMEHPETHCVVCHNPHDETNQHFLRKPAPAVCTDCHKGFANGLAGGMHPLGSMPYDVPQELLAAGAEAFGKSKELTCLTCHSTHSSTHKPLLVMPADTNQLCLSCHERGLAEMGPDGKLPRHGQMPKLNAEQRKVVEGRGARVGTNGELLCVSCHKVHHAEPNADLLAFRPKSEDACSACHPKQAGVVGTVHDLRTNFPDEKNAAGMTPREAGACSGCHTAHRPARAATPGEADVSGQCTSCHRADGIAGKSLAGNAGHPGTNCAACHNPHESGASHFLVKDQPELCRTCHAEQYALTGGPHDTAKNAEKWAKLPNGGEHGPCLACHAAHGAKGSGLSRLPASTDRSHDGACLSCHPDAAWGAATSIAAIHPQKISPDQQRVPLAMVPTDDGGNPRIGCRTCHNPHAGAEPVHLARVKPGEPTATLCTHCHTEKSLIEKTGHATARLAAAGFAVDSCKPCHAMHADPSGAWGQMLSPRFLTAGHPASQPVDLNTGTSDPAAHEAAVPCLVCHHENGPAPVREIATHPPVALANILQPDAPGFMPLFNKEGKPDPRGQITCRTCHLSHGQTDLLKAAPGDNATSPDDARVARAQVRPFAAPNLCTQCHGTEARQKFLFFHDAKQRKK